MTDPSEPRSASGRDLAPWALGAIVLIGFVLRLWGTLYGLPFGYHPDEEHILEPARAIAGGGGLDPGWYRYPTLPIWLHAMIVAVVDALAPSGEVTFSAVDEQVWIGRLVGRAFTACVGTAAVAVTLRAVWKRYGTVAAIVTGACAAVSPLLVLHSHFITTDALSAAASAGVLAACLSAPTASSPVRRLLLGAALAGLAAGLKYNAGLVVIAPLATWVALRPRRAHVAVLGCGLASLAAFLVAMPYAWLNPSGVWADLLFEARHYGAGGHVGHGDTFGPWVLGEALVWQGIGVASSLLAVAGIASMVRARRLAELAALVAFPALYFAFLSAMTVHLDRNLLPLLPFVAACAGVGADTLRARFGSVGAVAAIVLLALLPGVRTLSTTAELVSEDTRTEAHHWLAENVAPNTRVCREFYTPELPPWHRAFDLPAVCGRGEALLRQGCDVVITSSFITERFEEGTEAECYGALAAEWRSMARFVGTPVGILHDPTIDVWLNPGAQVPGGR